MTILRGIVTVIGLVVSVAAVESPPAQPATVFVQVAVVGADDRPVAGLAREDFRVTRGGQPVAIESFDAGPASATLVVLFDVSASLDGTYGPGKATTDLRTSVDAWLATRPASNHRWQLGRFARDVRIASAPLQEAQPLRDSAAELLGVADTARYGPSPAWDATDAGVTALESESGRKSAILVTDGRSTGNHRGLGDVARHAVAAGVPVSVIGPAEDRQFELDRSTVLLVSPAPLLQLLATETGGGYHPALVRSRSRTASAAAAGDSLTGLLDRIAVEVGQSYLIGVSIAGATPSPQRLEVTVTRPSVTVRAPASIVAR